jgi:hypothetical protein
VENTQASLVKSQILTLAVELRIEKPGCSGTSAYDANQMLAKLLVANHPRLSFSVSQ